MHVGDDAHSHRAPLASLASTTPYSRGERSAVAAVPPAEIRGPRRRSDNMLWRPLLGAVLNSRCTLFFL